MLTSAAALQGIVTSLADLNQRQTDISTQMSSGLRLSALSDDPTAAGQAVTNADALEQQDAFIATANTVGNRMQAADSAMASVVTQLTSAVSTTVGALSQDAGSTSAATALQQLTSIRDSLVDLANSSYNGAYLFSGSSTAQPFTQAPDGTVTYNGNAQTSSIALYGGGSLATSVAGSQLFTASGASVFDSLNAVISQLSSGTTPDAATTATLTGNLRNALTNVTVQRAALDTAQNRLSSATDSVTTQQTNLTATQSTLLSADTATLATDLSSVTTQRDALLSTLSIVQKGSLFDYLNG